MIGSVRGTVLERSVAGEVLVEVGGLGYRVLVPSGAVPALAPGGPAFLFTHLHVREDAMVLFGFPTRDERDTFEILIGASGVGPKLGLAMLSVHSPSALRRVLLDGDLDALTLVPGVGKRTAQKLMVLLKSQLDVPDVDLAEVEAGAPSARAEVRAALTELGYGPEEIRAAVAGLDDAGLSEDVPAEDLLRAVLKQLAVRT
ncbi:MAG: Holliday junction branch migration protein RuvA [Acidimicrobiia bacterium]